MVVRSNQHFRKAISPVVAIVKAPCDEQVIDHKEPTRPIPCPKDVGRAVLVATILASSMVFIDGSAVNVALPVLQRELGATAAQAQWVVESYALFLAALLLVGGVLGDRYGRKRIFLHRHGALRGDLDLVRSRARTSRC